VKLVREKPKVKASVERILSTARIGRLAGASTITFHAAYYMKQEPKDHPLQTTALINEAYLRLLDYRKINWKDRVHFMAIMARLMRRILDYAQRRGIHEIFGDVLQENRTMLKLCDVLGFKRERAADEPGIVRVTLQLETKMND